MDDLNRNSSDPQARTAPSRGAKAPLQRGAYGAYSATSKEKSARESKDGQGRPVFDYNRSLARLGGDSQLFTEIAALFLEDSPQLLEQARRALAEGDIATVARAAHSLQGLSANFEAIAMATAANIVEQHTRDRDLQGAAACFPTMEAELGRLQEALARLGISEDPSVATPTLADGDTAGDPSAVTQDIDRVQRLGDLHRTGVLSVDEEAFLTRLEEHRVGAVIHSEVVATDRSQTPTQSSRMVLSSEQRSRADEILESHGH